MFVKALSVLYELRLTRLETSSEVIHAAYEKAFRQHYKYCDEHTDVQKDYGNMPKCVLRKDDWNLIEAAGGRRSKSERVMKKREKSAAKVDRTVSRVRARLAALSARQQKALSTSSPRRVVATWTALQ
ncbi:hypothetical protein D3C85_161100 [compost metagenome]